MTSNDAHRPLWARFLGDPEIHLEKMAFTAVRWLQPGEVNQAKPEPWKSSTTGVARRRSCNFRWLWSIQKKHPKPLIVSMTMASQFSYFLRRDLYAPTHECNATDANTTQLMRPQTRQTEGEEIRRKSGVLCQSSHYSHLQSRTIKLTAMTLTLTTHGLNGPTGPARPRLSHRQPI